MLSSLRIVTTAFLTPFVDGLNSIVKVAEPLGAITVGVNEAVYSELFVETEVTVKLIAPRFSIVKLFVYVPPLTSTLPKSVFLSAFIIVLPFDNVIPFPLTLISLSVGVPETENVYVLSSESLLLIEIVDVLVPDTVGLNVTVKVAVLPGVTTDGENDAVKSDNDEFTEYITKLLVPVFCII